MPRSLVRTSRFALFALLAIVPLACGDDEESTTEPEENVVEIHLTGPDASNPLAFVDADRTIEVGTTVRWINDSETFHTITPRDADQPGGWDRATVQDVDDFFEHTFDVAGEVYEYFCEPHEADGMEGTITVE